MVALERACEFESHPAHKHLMALDKVQGFFVFAAGASLLADAEKAKKPAEIADGAIVGCSRRAGRREIRGANLIPRTRACNQ